MITEEEFKAYEQVRASGVTNMFDIRTVMALSDLNQAQIVEIMGNYTDLADKYLEPA